MTNKSAREIMTYRWLLLKKCRDPDDIDDIMQDAILKILQNDGKLENLTSAERRRYIIRCVLNSYVDFIRRKKRKTRDGGKRISLSDLQQSDYEACAALSIRPDAFGKIELKEVFEKGQKHQFFPIIRAFAEGYSNKDIAKTTGQKLNTILGRCRYVRKYLNK